jgi:hypothetical protein
VSVSASAKAGYDTARLRERLDGRARVANEVDGHLIAQQPEGGVGLGHHLDPAEAARGRRLERFEIGVRRLAEEIEVEGPAVPEEDRQRAPAREVEPRHRRQCAQPIQGALLWVRNAEGVAHGSSSASKYARQNARVRAVTRG